MKVLGGYRIGIPGTSITQGHSGSIPAQSPQWQFPLRDTLRGFWVKPSGLARAPGTKILLVTQYDWGTPVLLNGGVAGDTILQINAGYVARCGGLDPDIVLVEAGANDVGSGTLSADLDTLWATIVNPASYGSGKLPKHVAALSVQWRGSEATGGFNQANIIAMNPVIQAKALAHSGAFSDGTSFIDIWSVWAARRPTVNPGNLDIGIYTTDGTHPTLFGAQLYSEVVSGSMQKVL